MTTALCPECDNDVELGEDPRTDKNQPVRQAGWEVDCDECGMRLQVISLEPPKVIYAESAIEDDEDEDDDEDEY